MSISATIGGLLDREGLGLLSDTRRLDAFLRDLHPERPQEIFLLVEVAESGVLERLRTSEPGSDADQRGCAEQLSAASGIASNLALWAVQTWSEALPDAAWLDAASSSDGAEPSAGLRWEGSIEEVLGLD